MKESKTRKDKAERAVDACATAYAVLQEPSPDRALLCLLIKALTDLTGYASYATTQRRIDITEQGLKIMVGRLKSDKFVVEENGFLRLTLLGKGYIHTLQGMGSRIYGRYKTNKK